MTTLYKLTTQDNITLNSTIWGPGVTHTAPGKGELCTAGWIHAYESAEIAVLMNPIHADITNPKLWVCEGEIGINDNGLKCGTAQLTTLYEVPIPVFTTVQKVAFGIYCALEVHKNQQFVTWAEKWLSGEDRSWKSARATYADADAADAYAVAADAAAAAAYAAYDAVAADTYAAYAAYDAVAVAARKSNSIPFGTIIAKIKEIV